MGLDKETAEAILEREARVYRLTMSQLVTFAEYIPIPDDYFNKKMDLLGVPKEERTFWKAYRVARVLDEWLKALYREIERDYVEGEINDTEFKNKLNQIATLWGRVKEIAGVDWILWSPKERQLMYQIAKEKRERYMKRRRRGS